MNIAFTGAASLSPVHFLDTSYASAISASGIHQVRLSVSATDARGAAVALLSIARTFELYNAIGNALAVGSNYAPGLAGVFRRRRRRFGCGRREYTGQPLIDIDEPELEQHGK